MGEEYLNIMQEYEGKEAYEVRKQEDKNYEKGLLGYAGGIKGFLDDTTAGITLSSSVSGMMEAIPDALDPRSYTKEGQVEKMLESAEEEAEEGIKIKKHLIEKGLYDEDVYGKIYGAQYNKGGWGSPMSNYPTAVDNIKTKMAIPDLNIDLSGTLGNTEPVTVKPLSEDDVDKKSNSNLRGVKIPTLGPSGIGWNLASRIFSSLRKPR